MTGSLSNFMALSSLLWRNQTRRRSSRRIALNGSILVLTAWFIAGCETDVTTSINQQLIAIDKEIYLGHTYKSAASYHLYPRPDLPINQGNDCVYTEDKGVTSVVDIIGSNGQVYGKLRLSDGREGYVLEEELRLLDQLSRPSPKIGMTEDKALDTIWERRRKRTLPSQGDIALSNGSSLHLDIFTSMTGFVQYSENRIS